MNIWKRIWQLNLTQLFQLIGVLILKPLYVFPTLKATRQTLKICDSLYGKEHYKNTAANAFRHALWNILICKKVFQIQKKEEKALDWVKKITDLHEKLVPNKTLETAMDLHNNKVGRIIFKENPTFSEEKFIGVLQGKVKSAKKIKSISELKGLNEELVFIE